MDRGACAGGPPEGRGVTFQIPTLAEQQAKHAYRPQPKGASRLQAHAQAAKAEATAEARWKREVWIRDRGCCRWCKRKVVKTIALVPERGECHHISGRVVPAFRYDRRNGLLVCLACHERLTGMVNEKHVVVPTKMFRVDGVAYTNADHAVMFTRIA